MALIKYCSINNKGGPVINLQCSRNSTNAVSFYTQNGFYYNPNDISLIPKAIKPTEQFWIDEAHLGLMICSRYYFGMQRKEKIDDKSNEVQSHQDSNQIIDLSLDNRSDEIKLSDEKVKDLREKINN